MEETLVATKRNKVTVLLNTDEFQRFEAYCTKRGFKKSTLIARLIRDHLDDKGFSVQQDLPFSGHSNDERRGVR